jgi:hypothetical protein
MKKIQISVSQQNNSVIVGYEDDTYCLVVERQGENIEVRNVDGLLFYSSDNEYAAIGAAIMKVLEGTGEFNG